MAERADLIDAIRLPSDAFPDTSVVADVIFLRKSGIPRTILHRVTWIGCSRSACQLPYEGQEVAQVSGQFAWFLQKSRTGCPGYAPRRGQPVRRRACIWPDQEAPTSTQQVEGSPSNARRRKRPLPRRFLTYRQKVGTINIRRQQQGRRS